MDFRSLSRAFAILNEGLFDKKLPDPEFHISTKQKNALNFRHPRTIQIGPKIIVASRREIFDGLVHVMVHFMHDLAGVEDFNRNHFHKMCFVEEIVQKGMYVYKDNLGWSNVTSRESTAAIEKGLAARQPTPASHKKLIACYSRLVAADLELQDFKNELRVFLAKKPKVTYQHKYTCQGCDPPVIIRSGRRPGPRALNVLCCDCNTKFVYAG